MSSVHLDFLSCLYAFVDHLEGSEMLTNALKRLTREAYNAQ